MLFQVARPFPGLAFVVGERDGQAVAAAGRVVVDQQPVAVGQADAVEAGAGVGQVGGRRPGPRSGRRPSTRPCGCVAWMPFSRM